MKSGLLLAALAVTTSVGAATLELEGEPIQGGLIFGTTQPGSQLLLDTTEIQVSPEGRFVIGFGRDETGTRTLQLTTHTGETLTRELPVMAREYDIERVDGLPQSRVTPDPSVTERIRAESALVRQAKKRRDNTTDYSKGFIWPATGRLSGFYGSQRILNGTPRNPHYGLDIAAPEGTTVVAPAAGLVTLTHPDLYFSGGTIIIDHGQGLSSSFLHLSEILVEAGTRVQPGDVIARIGATGRATGPHLDWRMSWLDRRVDPLRLLPEQPVDITK